MKEANLLCVLLCSLGLTRRGLRDYGHRSGPVGTAESRDLMCLQRPGGGEEHTLGRAAPQESRGDRAPTPARGQSGEECQISSTQVRSLAFDLLIAVLQNHQEIWCGGTGCVAG